MTRLRFSHAWCRVHDLRAAVDDFTALGFTVSWGSAPASAHNALIWFRTGPFIEVSEVPRALGLLRFPLSVARGRATGERMARWAARHRGWRDLALETDETSLHGVREDLRRRGLQVGKVCRGRRTRPDGQVVSYEYLAVRPARLPFVVSSYVPPQRPEDVVHANGATGIHAVHYGLSPADRGVFDALVSDRRWIVVHDAARSGILGVEIDGLAAPLDPALLHGAVITPRQS